MDADRAKRLQDFVDWTRQHITGDEKGQAQIFLDRLFQSFGQRGSLDVGGAPEFRVKKAREDGGGTSFADYVWKPVVLIEMKKRGADLPLTSRSDVKGLARHHRQAFDYWIRLAPGRPKYTVLCNFDEFWVYDLNEQIEEPMDKLVIVTRMSIIFRDYSWCILWHRVRLLISEKYVEAPCRSKICPYFTWNAVALRTATR
jgi:hypothetical protein